MKQHNERIEFMYYVISAVLITVFVGGCMSNSDREILEYYGDQLETIRKINKNVEQANGFW